MRSFFLFLSRRRGLRNWMETSSLAGRLAKRFVAGETLEQAIAVSRRLNQEKISVTIDCLGESVTSLEEAARACDVYQATLTALHESGVEGNVSLKLTQFGLDLSAEECRRNVDRLAASAAAYGLFVRVDMESSEYVDRTLRLVMDLDARYHAVGAVIQSYLYRSRKDVEALNERGIRVRLVKGAYLESPSVAFARKADADKNFIELMKLLLDRGAYPAIATHDEKIIAATRAYAAERNLSRDAFEFQMLYGIRRDLQRQLVADGFRLRLYVPFGQAWYPYYMRRIAERPANALFVLKNLFR
ncbi:MAG: proline dehydrogenase family protein [Bryobacteraceae bacterium]